MKKRPYKHAAIKQPTWQNPLLEYWDARSRRRARRSRLPRRRRCEYQILAMLAFFSASVGLWENFRQLWLQDNGFNATGVSGILSFGMLLSVVAILLVGKFVRMTRIKSFMTSILVLRSIGLIVMFFLYHGGNDSLVAILTDVEVVTSALIITSVYPLLTTVMKSNHAYSRRKLVEYLFRDVGILIGGILIGRQIGEVMVDYNLCLMIAVIFSLCSAFILCQAELNTTERAPVKEHFSAVKYVWRSRVHRTYMIYVFIAAAAYNAAIGLRMLMLTDYFDLSAGMATTYLLIVGLAADFLGILALRHFTPKNDFTSMLIKFGTRFILFLFAFFSGNLFVSFLALTWTSLSHTTYENISDGYYINAIDNRHQLKYNTLRYVVAYLGDAFGIFLCGQAFAYGPGAILGVSAVLILPQLIVAKNLIKERKTYGFKRIYKRH